MTTDATDNKIGTDRTDLDLEKCPTGIEGLDEITGGGLPKGRPTLVCGSAGCGKTLLGMEFLVRGVTEYRITDHGVELLDVYLGPGGALTGSARLAQEAKERAEKSLREQEFRRNQAQMEAERTALAAQIAALQAS